MDMKQRIEDLSMLLKSDRKTQLIAIGLVLVVGILFFGGGSETTKSKRPKSTQPGPSMVVANSGQEAYEDLLKSFSGELNQSHAQASQNAEEIRLIRDSLDAQEKRTVEIFKKIIDRINESEASRSTVDSSLNKYPSPVDVQGDDPDELEADDLETFGPVEATNVAPPAPPALPRIAMVGAGDSVRVKLLAGVNAPTDGTPYPVVFKLLSDVYGPDGSALPLGEARLIAAAQGSLSDQRALFRLTTLNTRMPSGERKVIPVDGWVVGEDGVRGMSGILIDPIGKLVGASAIAGGIEGIGEGLAQAQLDTVATEDGVYQSLDGSIGEYAAGRAASGAANQYSNLIVSRINELVPSVRVLSGREATAVFSQSFTIPGLLDQLEDQNDQFASLD